MVKTIIVDENLLLYLTGVSQQNAYAVGLILGQSCLGQDYVIHFAKTPPCQSEEDKKLGKPPIELGSLTDVNGNWLADHARQATRMLSGGLHVLGLFVISPDDCLNPLNQKIKSLLQIVHNDLNNNKYIFGSPKSEKLIIHLSSKTQKYYGKTYDVHNHNVSPIDIKTQKKKWIQVQCDLKLNKLRYLLKDECDWPLEKHIKVIMDEINGTLQSAVYLFDGEFKDKSDTLESIGTKKIRHSRTKRGVQDDAETLKPLKVSILQTKCGQTVLYENITDTCGNIQLVGKVACKLWLQPKLTINEAADAVREDILRSLAARLEMHWDSLTEEENSEDINSVHEPPRRVLISLPNSEVALSDYLFPGEGPQEAKMSLEELLDIKIDGELDITDVEGQADSLEVNKYYKSALNCDFIEDLPKITNPVNKLMYVGLAMSLIILLIAIMFNFF
ncbi:protein odr-4 homolog [Diorhabda carinulata]|uniref:protein odr-4 homolog n=1 Tax=Diorhabda carinulata TaxID=1163345 RepID=UPI0025A0138A|nr:protein odr-4 homolog [Diorhabda carinulata]XP_057671777.1 protein odr-4 homolog [Diorhabda carinulata]